MASDPNFDVVALGPRTNGQEVEPQQATIVTLEPPLAAPPAPAEVIVRDEPAAIVFPEIAVAAPEPVVRKKGRAWVASLAVGLVGVIATGTLGYFLYNTTVQRDTTIAQLLATKATLNTTEQTLSAAQADAAAKKVTADYLAMFVQNKGRVQTDYYVLVSCKTYAACLMAAQALQNDLQTFQAERSLAHLSPALTTPDGMLADSISAAISGTQLFISGFETYSESKAIAGERRIVAAFLAMAKAEAALGTAVG